MSRLSNYLSTCNPVGALAYEATWAYAMSCCVASVTDAFTSMRLSVLTWSGTALQKHAVVLDATACFCSTSRTTAYQNYGIQHGIHHVCQGGSLMCHTSFQILEYVFMIMIRLVMIHHVGSHVGFGYVADCCTCGASPSYFPWRHSLCWLHHPSCSR